MDTLINFFTLRPTFTFWGLRALWYLYLLNVVVQTYVSLSTTFRVLAQRGVHINWATSLPNFLPLILNLVVQLIIVRLLLEVAAIIISNSRPGSRDIE